MGLLRKTVLFSIRNHWAALTPVYCLEFFRDCLILKDSINPESMPLASKYLFGPANEVYTEVLGLGFTKEQGNMLMWYNHAQMIIFASVLLFEKLYLYLSKAPRPKMKGAIGHHFQRWIDYHYITIAAGVFLKFAAEHRPESLHALGLQSISAKAIHFYCSLFLFLELLIGIVVRMYMYWYRRQLSLARKKKSKDQ